MSQSQARIDLSNDPAVRSHGGTITLTMASVGIWLCKHLSWPMANLKRCCTLPLAPTLAGLSTGLSSWLMRWGWSC